ncbi:hypothetical protein AB0H57_26355 [Micromonospora sp. NPDC050686]|uniref:hypothetical protein n=1 Tax=Micromonospora sp. NPDC050686 TaxID=3154631 RepID=UPI0033F9F8A1
MWALDGQALDRQARGLFSDLCFLDERDQDLDVVFGVLQGYGRLGVAGPFIALFGTEHDCRAEVASVFAEQFHALGYLQAERLVDPAEFKRLTASLRERFDGRDVRRSEVEAAYGSSSLVVDKRVLCYAPADRSGWVFFDCFTECRSDYVPGAGRYEGRVGEDPLVRAVRRPATDFEAGLILTLYGKVLRWGPGWWLHQPEGLPDEQRAIAAQLRHIESADPSQSLRRSRHDPRS